MGLMCHKTRVNHKLTSSKIKNFEEFRGSLDAEMKRLQSMGIGLQKHQAEALSEDDEALLWSKVLLGDSTPKTLLDTKIFCYSNGLYFALRSGKEHCQLRSNPDWSDGNALVRSHFSDTEYVTKNHPVGQKRHALKLKVVILHSNDENPEWCFVRSASLLQCSTIAQWRSTQCTLVIHKLIGQLKSKEDSSFNIYDSDSD